MQKSHFISFLLIALSIQFNYGMFFKGNKRPYVTAVLNSDGGLRTLRSINAKISKQAPNRLYIQEKMPPTHYGYLSAGISVAAFGSVAKIYTNLHQSLIRYEPSPTEQQLQEDERALNLVNNILYGSFIAQNLILFRNSVKHMTRTMMRSLKQLA